MCGRFTYQFTWKQLRTSMSLSSCPEEELSPRYNVAPSQPAPVIRHGPDGARVGALLRWGLIPPWAADPGIGSRFINARAETLAEKPTYRKAFSERRCVLPVSGFYEWGNIPGSTSRQPYYIHASNDETMMLAGLWERWLPREGGPPTESFTIITCPPNKLMAEVHDRMPVVIDPDDLDTWLDPNTPQSVLSGLLRPYPAELMMKWAVSPLVNSPKNEGIDLIRKAEATKPTLF